MVPDFWFTGVGLFLILYWSVTWEASESTTLHALKRALVKVSTVQARQLLDQGNGMTHDLTLSSVAYTSGLQ